MWDNVVRSYRMLLIIVPIELVAPTLGRRRGKTAVMRCLTHDNVRYECSLSGVANATWYAAGYLWATAPKAQNWRHAAFQGDYEALLVLLIPPQEKCDT